jgi:hypothetical protein
MGFEYSSLKSTGPLLAGPSGFCFHLPKSEDGQQGFINTPELLSRHVPNEVAKPGGVNSSHLFYQDSRGLSFDIHLGSEGGGPCTPRSRGYKDNGSWQQFICLDDNPKAPTLLFVPATSRWRENVHITPEHADSP